MRRLPLLFLALSFPFSPLAAGPSDRATLAGSAPPWAASSSFKAPAAATDFVNFRVYLGWQDAQGLEALEQQVSDPARPRYRQVLTPAQILAAYAPAQASVAAVHHWLTDPGLT